MGMSLKDCATQMITPASSSAIAGFATALILYAAGASQGDTTVIASQYLAALAKLATENTIAAMSIAGGVTTALCYTFVAKPIAVIHAKCKQEEQPAHSILDGLYSGPYHNI